MGEPEGEGPPTGRGHGRVPARDEGRPPGVVRVHRARDLEVTERLRVEEEAGNVRGALDPFEERYQPGLRVLEVPVERSTGFGAARRRPGGGEAFRQWLGTGRVDDLVAGGRMLAPQGPLDRRGSDAGVDEDLPRSVRRQ